MSDEIVFETTPEELSRVPRKIDINGETYTGKTRLAFTSRKPITVFHAGERVADEAEKCMTDNDGNLLLSKGRDGVMHPNMNVYNYADGTLPGETKEQISKAYGTEVANLRRAMEKATPWAQTFVFDTGSAMYGAYTLMHFGAEKPDPEKGKSQRDHYGPINAEWRRLMHYLDTCGPDLVFVNNLKQKYIDNEPKGGMISACHKDMPRFMDLELRTGKQILPIGDGTEKLVIFKTTLLKTSINAQALGTVIPDATLPQILSLVYDRPEAEFK